MASSRWSGGNARSHASRNVRSLAQDLAQVVWDDHNAARDGIASGLLMEVPPYPPGRANGRGGAFR